MKRNYWKVILIMLAFSFVTPIPTAHAIQKYKIVDLGTLGGTGSIALDINEQGQIVGDSSVAGDQEYHPAFWSNGAVRDLDPLGGLRDSGANAINDAGQVVGIASYSKGECCYAAVYSKGHAIDLNTLTNRADWHLYSAEGINNKGYIVGYGYKGGETRAFLLTPYVEVAVDVKPGSDPVCLNPNDRGAIPVAIHGSADLDVKQINIDSLSLEGLAAKTTGKSKKYLSHYDYANGDSYLDLVVHFQNSDGWIAGGNGQATITGKLMNDSPIEGKDTVCLLP